MNRALVIAFLLAALAPSQALSAPRLGVLIVFDQMRAADLVMHRDFFGRGGFGGIAERGAHHDATYPYAITETGPGHATIATGATPDVHGIAANRWWIDGKRIYSVEDASAKVLGAKEDARGLGPAHLRAPTLGDALKAATNGVGRVITLSHKDRAAILTAGTSADHALWYDPGQGRFTTSTHYSDALPAWIETFNAALPARLEQARWSPLPTPKNLRARLPVDDHVGEELKISGRVFPHDLADSKPKRRRKDYRGTPTALADIFALSRAAITEEGLGDDAAPDLLVIAVSTVDFAGHWWGPGSLEVLDLLRRADAEVRAFTAFLDARLGRNGWTMALTSDHGAPPLVERAQAAGIRSARIPAKPLFKSLRAVIEKTTGDKKDRLAGAQPPHLYLDLSGLTPALAERTTRAVAEHLARTPGIASAMPSVDLPSSTDPYADALRRSVAEGRTGHVLVRVEPYTILDFSEDGTGVDHGTPYAYDRQVPVILVGPRVRRGRYGRSVDPRDVAPTLAHLLGIPPPAAAQGVVLESVGP